MGMDLSKKKFKKIKIKKLRQKEKEREPVEPIDMIRKNEQFVKILSEIEFIKMKKGEFMSAKRYKDAQEAIMKINTDINSVDDLKNKKFIGKRMIEVLTEFQDTGKVEYLETEKKNPVNIFANIYGIGYIKAEKLVKNGYTTIDDLRKNQDKELNDKQKLGLQYYEDILERIPREEINEYNEIFK